MVTTTLEHPWPEGYTVLPQFVRCTSVGNRPYRGCWWAKCTTADRLRLLTRHNPSCIMHHDQTLAATDGEVFEINATKDSLRGSLVYVRAG